MKKTAELLATTLVASGRVPAAALERAARLARENAEPLDAVLTRLGLISERDLAEVLAGALNLVLITAAEFPSEPVLEGQLSPLFLKEARLLPIEIRDGTIILAMTDPLNIAAAEAVTFAMEKPVQRRVACATDLEAAWDRLYGTGGRLADAVADRADEGTGEDIERLKDLASEAPVIRLVNQIIARAVEARASDIHIEPMPGQLRVRYRIDGVLQEVEAPPERLRSAVISRVKVMAKLNIAERRLAQDGRIRLAIRGTDIDLRVATTPTIHGEGVVLRILDRGQLALDFLALGFDAPVLKRFHALLAQPHGIVLSTGPTGSGKTTTLYAALLALNTSDRKILTIEDPVEYQLAGINQVQAKPQIGLNFATALRSFLRQDPDVMMVGEIRDLETAQVAVQAALTGHLLLSTLHTNDAASAVTRLLDMGVEDYLLTSTVNGIVGQRLVRKLCIACRVPRDALPAFAERLELGRLVEGRVTLWHAPGCPVCGGTGYHGRTMILEVLGMSDGLRRLVLQRAESRAIQRLAIEEGMETMQINGMRKALAGITTVEEVLRATRDD